MLDLIFSFLGGSALVIYGVDLMGESLETMAGSSLRRILTMLTARLWSSFLVGIVATAAVQSSTAITVLTVSFVHAGLLNLSQAVGIIYGANIGTTITAQLMAFRLTDFALPIITIGFALRAFTKRTQSQHIGGAIMGMGFLFLGLQTLHSGVPYIQSASVTRQLFITLSSNPLTALAAGMFTTVLVQSSSATVGLTMVLAQSGVIDLRAAVALTLGDNIGTCMTAQMASLHSSLAARRTAWAHTLYNVVGALAGLLLLKPFVSWMSLTSVDLGRQVANTHTFFNVLSALVFFPITGYYVRFLEWFVPDRK